MFSLLAATGSSRTLCHLEYDIALPDYKRPFERSDFRGYFRWSAALTRKLGGRLYHACHPDELEITLETEELGLRSEWSLKLPKHGLWNAPGTWVGLNYFVRGNQYGPCLIEFPLSVLNGRHFMVFRRTSDRKRYFFVQYEARLPIYSFGKKLWRNVNAASYFTKNGKTRLQKTAGAIYDIVITHPLSLAEVTIKGVNHPSCISKKCTGSNALKSKAAVDKLAVKDWRAWMADSDEYNRFIGRFPSAVGSKVKLFDPLETDDE